jgi:hypothetical protein
MCESDFLMFDIKVHPSLPHGALEADPLTSEKLGIPI